MKTNFSLFITSFVFIISTSGQVMKVKYGKVSPEDLAMKVYTPDSEAVAVVLSKVGRIQYDILQEKYSLSEEIHVVIKILNAAGIDKYGNVKLNYYSYNNYSKVGSFKGIVHLPDGTEVKVDNTQIFDETINDYWSSKKIAFPKLVPGAIIEYQYTILSDGMFHPVDWFFQRDIPIVYSELTTKIPDWFDFVILTQGAPLDQKESESRIESIGISGVERDGTWLESRKITQGTANINFINNTYINKDVPALKEECCITTMEDYYSRVRYQLNAIQYQNGSREPIMNTWEKLAERLYEIPAWGGQFRNKHPGELVLEAAGLNPSVATNQLETAQKVYDYINNNIQWNDYYSFSTVKEISVILKTKSGNSGDLNKLMCAALLQSGIEAKPVLISTRDNGKPLELYPFTEQFNHLVVWAKIDDKEMWIDLGDKNLPMGMLRVDALNTKAWIVDEVNPVWIDIKAVDSKTVYLIKGSLDSEGNFNGDLESRFTGYHALNQRTNAKEEKEKFGENLIACGSTPVPISGIELINAEDASKPFQLKAKIVNHPIAMVTPDKLYIAPMLPKGLDEIPFKLEAREYPIEMNYPEEISMILDVSLPEGYVVESLPEPNRFVTENGGIQVTYSAAQEPGKLKLTLKYVIKQLHFEPDEYPILKNLYDLRYQKFNEQIVLARSQ